MDRERIQDVRDQDQIIDIQVQGQDRQRGAEHGSDAQADKLFKDSLRQQDDAQALKQDAFAKEPERLGQQQLSGQDQDRDALEKQQKLNEDKQRGIGLEQEKIDRSREVGKDQEWAQKREQERPDDAQGQQQIQGKEARLDAKVPFQQDLKKAGDREFDNAQDAELQAQNLGLRAD